MSTDEISDVSPGAPLSQTATQGSSSTSTPAQPGRPRGEASITGSDQPPPSTNAAEPNAATNTVLATCSTAIDDFRASRLSKARTILLIHNMLAKSMPSNPASIEEAFNHFLNIIENHEHHIASAEKRGNRERLFTPEAEEDNEDPDVAPPSLKRTKPDESEFPWVISDTIRQVNLSPSLTKSLGLLKLYAVDPKGTKRSLINSPSCPEFPDQEWTNVLSGRAVNLDAVLTGYYSTSNNDERVEEVGEVELGQLSPRLTFP